MSIVPEQGNWEISPLVFGFMERRGIRPLKPLDELLPDLLEKVHLVSGKEGRDLTDCFVEVLGMTIPEFGEELTGEFPINKIPSLPSPWILFTPPTTTSAFTQHLMRDYERLEKRLESHPDQTGGLGLLEDLPVVQDVDQVDLLPIVLLNDSQRKAVAGILKSRPVTVISGPPGCGKSQVVVSLLLNAWAKGISVLFASNNNQAVDVVRERLERFESDFPIAIRAGAKDYSNIEESFRRTHNIVATGTRSGRRDAHSATTERNQLLSSQKRRRDFLDSQLPQRIDQALRSALKAYSQYQAAIQDMNDERERVVKGMKDIGYNIAPEEFTIKVSRPLRAWLERINDYRRQIEQDTQDRSSLYNRATAAANTRNLVVQQAGLDPNSIPYWDSSFARLTIARARAGLDPNSITNWNWLVLGPGPELLEAWLENYKVLLSEPLEQRLSPYDWHKEFESWEGEVDARNWGHTDRQLIKDIRRMSGELSPRIAEVEDIKSQFDEQLHTIKEYGIPDGIQIHPDLLSEWVLVYATEYSLPKSKFDWWPWSQRNKLIRKLRSLEDQIRPAYPLVVWRKIGEMNRTGRESLSEIVELTHHWITIRNLWSEKEVVRKEIESSLQALRGRAAELRIDGIPSGTDLSAWLKVADTIEEQIKVADKAVVAWNKRVIAEQTRERLCKIAIEFQSVASGVPIKEAWMKGPGSLFVQSVSALSANPVPADIVSARSFLVG